MVCQVFNDGPHRNLSQSMSLRLSLNCLSLSLADADLLWLKGILMSSISNSTFMGTHQSIRHLTELSELV